MVRPGGAGARPASPAGANLRPDRGSAPGPGDAEAGAPGTSAGPAGTLVPGRATAACITSAAASSKPYAGFPGGLRPRTPLREVAMFVYEVMRTPVITLRPDDTVRQAIRVLYGNHITAAPVVGERGELAGMVSEIDLLTAELRAANTLDRNFPETSLRVANVMSRTVVTVTEDTEVSALLDLMINMRVKTVPVIRGFELVGIVTRRDLMAMLATPDETLRDVIVELLRRECPAAASCDVVVRDGEVELRGGLGEWDSREAEELIRTVPGVVRVTRAG
ncbi:CBS domain-containing protein [Thermobispora bispora]|nr:CBS domain-containing protein [Actinomycetales bacterium]QSI47089.1 CBS domain-containing protein [Thermobispora bispora]